MKEWQQGYELGFLKQIGSVFKNVYKPYTYGAFGIPNERDIAAVLKSGEIIYTKAGHETVQAAAIFRHFKSASQHEDFCGRKAQIKAGDLLVRSLAGSAAGMERVLRAVIERVGSKTVWVEAHVENREAVQMLQNMGFRHVMTKIAASSDLKGLWILGETAGRLPAPLIPSDAVAMKCLQKDFISVDQQQMVLEELRAYEATRPWAQHYSNYNKRQSWTAFALHGYDPQDPGFIIKPQEMSKQWKAENPHRLTARCGLTDAGRKLSKTWQLVRSMIPAEPQRIRLMRLSSKGGELTRHADITDPEAGTKNGQVVRLHIPLQTHQLCQFLSWDLMGHQSKIHFAERGLYYLDTRKPHAVFNNSPEDRIHLVCDVFSNDWVRGLINR